MTRRITDLLVTKRHHSPRPRQNPEVLTKTEWEKLITPEIGERDVVVIGRRKNEQTPRTIEEARQQVDALTYHELDPFVASVATGVSAGRTEIPKGETIVKLQIPEYYAEDVEVQLGTHNGEDAPMMVILPGIQGSGQGSLSKTMKKLALERGMNYVTIPNSLAEEMLEDAPLQHPGNPRVDALGTQQMLEQLQEKFPKLFRQVSVGGYSYGALHGANLVRLQEENDTELINGSLVAISPPENLDHSMHALDGLRDRYAEGAGSIPWTGLKYRSETKKHGYEGFMDSELASRGEGSNITEIKIADKYGSRDDMEITVELVDKHFGHNQLPKHTKEYEEAGFWKRRRMRAEHDKILTNMTYHQYGEDWMSKDEWLKEHGLTPEQAAYKYSFGEAMEVIKDTPVLVMASADDYILAEEDVQTLRELESSPGDKEVVRVFETGGHVGLTWNPKVQEMMADFAFAPPAR